MLKIVGLGPGDYNALTIGVLNQLKKNKNIYFRTEKHPTVDFLKEQGIIFNTYDHAYEMFDSFSYGSEHVYNDYAIEQVKKAGFKLAFIGGNKMVTKDTNPYLIPRYVIYKNTSLNYLKNLLS